MREKLYRATQFIFCFWKEETNLLTSKHLKEALCIGGETNVYPSEFELVYDIDDIY